MARNTKAVVVIALFASTLLIVGIASSASKEETVVVTKSPHTVAQKTVAIPRAPRALSTQMRGQMLAKIRNLAGVPGGFIANRTSTRVVLRKPGSPGSAMGFLYLAELTQVD